MNTVTTETAFLSLDLWDTVLRRRCHPDEIKIFTAQKMILLLRRTGWAGSLPCPMELFAARQAVEADIGTRKQKNGYDDEYEIEEVLQTCILNLTEGSLTQSLTADLVDTLVRAEIEQEIRVTYPDPDLLQLLKNRRYRKLYIVSDFYMSARKTAEILQAHSLPFSVDGYFISCDSGFNKRSGRLFKYVCRELDIPPACLTHIGDNRDVDVEMAEKSGIRAIHFIGRQGESARKQQHISFECRRHPIPDQSLFGNTAPTKPTNVSPQEQLRLYGRHLAPLFIGFSLFIQQIADTHDHNDVFFFTREGRFFKQVFERVAPCALFGMKTPAAHLLPVSRLATFFPSLRSAGLQDMMRLWSQYHTQSVTSFLGSLGLDPDPFLEICRSRKIDPEKMVFRPWQHRDFLTLFEDTDFVHLLNKAWLKKKNRLQQFLLQQNFGQNGKALTVDIGWRGTIQDNLALLCPETSVEGCYLGLQDFFNRQPENTVKHGYLADDNQGVFHPMLKHVMPFEMLCFGPGGSAVGYRKQADDKIEALFQIDCEEDRFFNEHIRLFQEGVLEAAEDICGKIGRHGISLEEVRNEARNLALRYLDDPPKIMCRTFHALKQDDTFGMARTIFPGRKTFRLRDRFLLYFSRKHRNRFFEDLEQSGWPQCLLRMRYFGLFYQLGKMKKRVLSIHTNTTGSRQ
jgi:HAD superfamily hydrolase (TIGR01549 family)